MAASISLASAGPAAAQVAFDRAFGIGVDTGANAFENCTAATGCQAGIQSDAAGGLSAPGGAAFDGEGGILVADQLSHRVHRFTVAGDGTIAFDRAFGIGVDTGANAFENCTAATGCETGIASGAAGGMSSPGDVAVDPQGRILVADQNNNRIDRFTVAGDGTVAFDRAFGAGVDSGFGVFESCTAATGCQAGIASAAAGGMDLPFGVAVDSQERILVADARNNRIARFAVAGDGTVDFDRAFGIGVDTGGGVFENCTNASGCQSGLPNGAAGGLSSPVGVAVDPLGRVLAGDQGGSRIVRYAAGSDGEVSFDRAFGAHVDPGGGGGFENCTTASGCRSADASGAAGGLASPFGVDVDTHGRIIVTDFLNRRMAVFRGPTVTVTKALAPAGDPGRFELRVGSTVVRASAGNGDAGSLPVPDGADVTISEVAATGDHPLSDYAVTIDCGAGPQSGASLALTNVTADVDCTITNTRTPTPPPEPPAPSLQILSVERDRKAGTATLTVTANVSGGARIARSPRVRAAAAEPIDADATVELEVVARKQAARIVARKGRVQVRPKVRLKPAAGGELQKRRKVNLRMP